MPPTGPVGRTRGAPPKLTVGTTATERTPPMKGSMAPMVPALRKFLVVRFWVSFLGAHARTEDRASASIEHSPVQGSAERTVIHPSLGARRLTRDGRRARERQEQHERTDESSHICSGKWLKGRHAGCGVESTSGPDAAREGGEGRRRRKAVEDGEVPRTFVAHVRVRLTCAMRPRTNDDSASTSKEDVETPLRRPNHPMRGKMKRFSNAATGPEPSVKPISNREWWFPKLAKADEQN